MTQQTPAVPSVKWVHKLRFMVFVFLICCGKEQTRLKLLFFVQLCDFWLLNFGFYFLLGIGRDTEKHISFFFPQTRLVPDRISRRCHSHGKEHIQGRGLCQLHGKRGINTFKCCNKTKRVCSDGLALGFSSRGPIRWVSHTHRLKHTHADTHSPHGPNYASSGALLTLLPKYRSKNNLPSPVSETS